MSTPHASSERFHLAQLQQESSSDLLFSGFKGQLAAKCEEKVKNTKRSLESGGDYLLIKTFGQRINAPVSPNWGMTSETGLIKVQPHS
jgi:hypothetical protein